MAQPPESVIPLSNRVGFLLNTLAAQIRASTEVGLRPFGLSPRLFGALETVVLRGPLSQIELSRLLAIDRTTTVDVVDLLEAMKLAERVPDVRDRRAHAVSVTNYGKTVHRKAGRAVEQVQAQFLSVLDEGECRALQEILLKLFNEQEKG